MTCRNVIFHATLIGSLLPIGLWAAAELATSVVNSPFVIRLLARLPNLSRSDLWYCMVLMIVCSLSIPAGRKQFNRLQSLLITLAATLTIVVTAVNLQGLVALNDSDTPVRIAAHLIEASMGAVVLLAFGIARFHERGIRDTDPELSPFNTAESLEQRPLTVGRPFLYRSNEQTLQQNRLLSGGNRSHVSP